MWYACCQRFYRSVLTALLLLVLTACGIGGQVPETQLKGVWMADIGVGCGRVTERLEFLGKGSVTSQKGPASYIGNYQILDDNRIRIDWKEQGLFGHSPSQIFTYEFKDNSLILTNMTSGAKTIYLREAAYTEQQSRSATSASIEPPHLAEHIRAKYQQFGAPMPTILAYKQLQVTPGAKLRGMEVTKAWCVEVQDQGAMTAAIFYRGGASTNWEDGGAAIANGVATETCKDMEIYP
jgi:hypothetical protein